ncbi:MAG: DNA mismatch repair endonuclease MutL [Longimicrobiales bacterium]
MTRRIHVLPDTLANQIAAGEVVERPASVVKELVENALDAAATRIEVELRNGGRTEIRVADNGCGMGREDALLSLDRHATSKLLREEDLVSIRSFGFRGEALPSIASVSRLTLETAEAGGVGTRVRISAGKIQGVEEIARQAGTTITVRNLFVNVPARAKFLRSAGVETRAVVDVIVSLSLANISTGFVLQSNGRVLLDLPAANDVVTRVASLWGEEAASRFVPISSARDDITVGGLVERPDASLSGPRRTHLFVDGRPFKDRDLLFAAERAYRTTVPHGARPSLVLYLNVAPGSVDVNVHPSKAEVRFRDKFAVEAVIEAAVHTGLGSLLSAATLDRTPTLPQLQPIAPVSIPQQPVTAADQLAFFVAAPERGIAGEPMTDREPEARSDAVALKDAGTIQEQTTAPLLWQIHDSYIVAETRSGLLIIDQHSAHERVLFQEIMQQFESGRAHSQRLLFPLTLRLSPAEYSVMTDQKELFERAGYEIEPFGGRTVIVHAAPAPHPYFNAERCLREMIAELSTGSDLTRSARTQYERLAMTFACKAAIKAGQRLTPVEMEELFERLFATDLPYHDVHGRPTVIRLSLEELARRFGRHG